MATSLEWRMTRTANLTVKRQEELHIRTFCPNPLNAEARAYLGRRRLTLIEDVCRTYWKKEVRSNVASCL